MNSEPNVIIIVLATILILIALAGSITIKEGSVTVKTLPSRIIVGILGILLLIVGILGPKNLVTALGPKQIEADSQQLSDQSKQPKGVEPSLKPSTLIISEPKSGSTVTSSKKVSGRYSQDISDDIWIFVWPELSPGRGWPQTDNAASGLPASKKNGEWSIVCNFGGPSQSYDVVAYTAAAPVSELLSNKLKLWSRNNAFVGISLQEMPKDLVEKARITVQK